MPQARLKPSVLTVAAVIASMPVYGETIQTTAPIIVTATRTAQTADESLASVTVISREQIEASGSVSVMELLQHHTAGLDVSRNGGPGSSTSLFLRGTESDHVLVLVDGVRASSVTSGGFNWAALPSEQIERIEVVRGPNSTLYGSEAIGGVIQIFTRKGKGLHASLTAGSYRTGKASVGSGGSLGKGRYHINLSHEQADGYSTTAPSSSRYEADEDAYRNSSIGTGFSLPLGSRAELALNLLHSNARAEYDDSSYSDAYADTQNSSAELRLDWQSSNIWSQRFALLASRDSYESHDSNPSDITTLRQGADWQNDLLIGDTGLLTLGLETRRDDGEISGKYDKSITSNAGYMQFQWNGERYDALLGARSDDHSEYGQHSTGRITLGSRLGGGRLYATYATAFKAPTFNELYYPSYGSSSIQPEESSSSEVGYRYGGLQASIYQTYVENMIQSDPDTWQAVNIGKARMEGVELEYLQRIGAWQLNAALTLQKAENEKTGKPLIRRAEKKLLFNARGPVAPRTELGVEVNYTGPRTDYSNVELTSYTLLNLTGEYRLSKSWRLQGRFDNLLDEEYQLVNGYNTAGASAYLTLSYNE